MAKQKLSDYEWFVKTDLSRYKGKYVAIADQKVVSSGYDAKKVYEEARKKAPQSKPALAKIPSEDVMVLVFPSR
jgi:ABC-type molybdate transport system substrate-binding protein